MPHLVFRADGTLLTQVEDEGVNTTATSLGLPGVRSPVQGEVINQNLVRIVENFASTADPQSPVRGQMWFSTLDNFMAVHNGSTWEYAFNRFGPPMVLSFGGDLSGSVAIDGSGDVTATVGLASTAPPASYTKFTVNNKGIVTAAGSLDASDVTTALGYVPFDPANILPEDEPQLPLNGIMLWKLSEPLPAGYVVCNGTGPTPNMTPPTPDLVYIMRTT